MLRLFKVTLTGNNGNKIVNVGKPYQYVCVMNHTSDANLTIAGGSFQSVPGDTIEVPAGADISMPIDVLPGDWNLSVWWDAGAGDVINVYCSDSPIYLGQGKPAGTKVTNTVTVSGAVSVSGPVDIGTMPAVDISSSSGSPVYVSVSSSVTLNIAGNVGITGNVNIGSMPAVSISSSSGAPVYVSVSSSVTLNANLTNSVINVAFPSAQQVTLAATGPVSITDKWIPSQGLVLVQKNISVNISNVANGASFRIDPNGTTIDLDPIMADGILVVWHSAGGYTYSNVQAGAWITAGFPSSPTSFVYTGNPTRFGAIGGPWGGGAGDGSSIVLFETPQIGNNALIYVTNNTGGTIVSDTITVSIWLIKAQVSNPISSPANIAPASGSFDTMSVLNGGSGGTGSDTVISLLAAGNYMAVLSPGPIAWSVSDNFASATINIYLKNGSQVLASAQANTNSGSPPVASGTLNWSGDGKPLGEGVANNGITVEIHTSGSLITSSATCQGYAILRSATPRQRTTTIV